MRMYAQTCYAFRTWDRLRVAEIRGAAFACEYGSHNAKIDRAIDTELRFSAGLHDDINLI